MKLLEKNREIIQKSIHDEIVHNVENGSKSTTTHNLMCRKLIWGIKTEV
jgi:hypothetical protein